MKRVFLLTITGVILFSIHSNSAYASSVYDLMINSDIYLNKKWRDLLHFKNGKSTVNSGGTFFLSGDGYKDAKAEYLATIILLFDETRKDDASIQCRYPERIAYITEELSVSLSELPAQICYSYEEYLEKVPVDSVYIVFAAEDNTYPNSMLGHSFIKLQGYDKDGHLREYAFSFFATFNLDDIILFNYIKAVFGGTDGIFSLSPYHDKIKDYLHGEKRSLWEFELKLTKQEKARLKRHLWELKGHKINYSFTSHNCNDALISILNVAHNSFNVDRNKFFITPLEYINELADNITNVSIVPSDTERKIINTYGLSNILNTSKSTRLALSYEKRSYSYLDLDFQLIYKDFNDYSDANFHESESKILATNIKYNVDRGRPFIDRIDLLKAKLLLDYELTGQFSKYYRLSFEKNLPEDDYFIGPVFEMGGGLATYNKYAAVYGLGVIGYSYHRESRFYTAPEVGVILRGMERVKFLSSLTYQHDFIRTSNPGHRFEYNARLDYALNKDQRVFLGYGRYIGGLNENNFKVGIAIHF